MALEASSFTSFGADNFGSARLGNSRRTQRLVRFADQFLAQPEGTLPDKLPLPKERKAFYRFMKIPKVTHASLLAPHQALVRRRLAAATGPLLLLHDSTELNFSGLRSLPDLGQLGTGKNRGFLCHNSLAVAADSRRVLGLAHQILYRRPRVPKGESRADRQARQDRESRLWQRSCEAIGPAPAGECRIDVADRGADIFEFLEFEHLHERSYTIRATHDRSVELVEPESAGAESPEAATRLFALARSLPAETHKTVRVAAREKHPERTASVGLAAAAVRVQAPQHARGDHGSEPLDVWVVIVRESAPPAGREPVEWILLTNVPVRDRESLEERVRWYEMRWLIEELHKGQKTGCSIEKLQLGKVNHDERGKPTPKNRLEPAIALLSVVAVQLLLLRDLGRDAEHASEAASGWFGAAEEAVLAGWSTGDGTRRLTLGEFCRALARLGGHPGRKGDGPPGWQTLWRGWQKLEWMVQGVRTATAGDVSMSEPRTEDPESG
jgi:hypothetical protein